MADEFSYRRPRRLRVWERQAFSEIARELAESDPSFRSPSPLAPVHRGGRPAGGAHGPDAGLAWSLAPLVIGLVVLVVGAFATSVFVLMVGVAVCLAGLGLAVVRAQPGDRS